MQAELWDQQVFPGVKVQLVLVVRWVLLELPEVLDYLVLLEQLETLEQLVLQEQLEV